MNPLLVPHLPRLREAASAEPIGLYLHVPFCKDRCTYCSFVSTRNPQLRPAFVARLDEEIRAWGEALGQPAVDTIYLGGGTPSLLEIDELSRITDAARESFDVSGLMESTLEANPGDLDADWLASAREMGWDRISLGVQTLDDALLEELGRLHSSTQALEAVEAARHAGFRRISADLMVGVPGQRLASVIDDAERLVALGVEHLSIYLLDLDKNCPMKARVSSGALKLPSDDDVADVFEVLQAALPDLGLEAYEISNYAVPGEESRHNTRYWERRPYLGLGPGAASQMAEWRWTETAAVRAWVEAGSAADSASLAELETLSPAEALAETAMLGLRMQRGVDWVDVRRRAEAEGIVPLLRTWERELEPLLLHSLLEKSGSRLRLTDRGRLLSNAVFRVFV